VPTRRVIIAFVVAACIAPTTAVAASASPPAGVPAAPTGLQTHPTVTPPRGGAHTTFVVRLTVRTALGVKSGLIADYRLMVSGGSASDGSAGCQATAARALLTAPAGRRVALALSASPAGWCQGRYSGQILLDRRPYCPPRRACPQFILAPVAVGDVSFVVSGQTAARRAAAPASR
jgi:hypothetical protein